VCQSQYFKEGSRTILQRNDTKSAARVVPQTERKRTLELSFTERTAGLHCQGSDFDVLRASTEHIECCRCSRNSGNTIGCVPNLYLCLRAQALLIIRHNFIYYPHKLTITSPPPLYNHVLAFTYFHNLHLFMQTPSDKSHVSTQSLRQIPPQSLPPTAPNPSGKSHPNPSGKSHPNPFLTSRPIPPNPSGKSHPIPNLIT